MGTPNETPQLPRRVESTQPLSATVEKAVERFLRVLQNPLTFCGC